jgi:hypothetical protein
MLEALTSHQIDYTMSASLANGVTVYTPVQADIDNGLWIEDVWVEIDTAWDGTTPTLDVGTFNGKTTGLFYAPRQSGTTPGPIDLSQADAASAGAGVSLGQGKNFSLANLSTPYASAPGRLVPARVTATNPILVVVSQDGTKGGSAVGGTAGHATVWIKRLQAVGPQLAFVSSSSVYNIADTIESTGTQILSTGAVEYDGDEVYFEFFAPTIKAPSVAGGFVTVTLFEGSTQITRLAIVETNAAGMAGTLNVPFCVRIPYTPSAGTHTYKLCAFASSLTGTPFILGGSGGTGGNPPFHLRVTKGT